MKRSMKRVLCGALSLMLASSLVVERTLRINAEPVVGGGTTATASVSVENVTGQFNTSALTASNFNSSVLTAEDTTPTYETRTVIVTLEGDTLLEKADGKPVSDYVQSWSGGRAAAEIAVEQAAFLRKLSQTGISYTVERSYDTVLNGVAIEVNTKHVSAIKRMAGVESVVITTAYAEPKTAESYSSGEVVTNETSVYPTGIYNSEEFTDEYGDGMVVAVLDTGLDYTHPAFQGFQSEVPEKAWNEEYVANVLANKSLKAESRSGSLNASDVYVSDKVPFAYDYADDDADVYPSYSNHGTHVAGIIGGYDTSGYTDKDGNPIAETFKGVVPDAQLAIFKVFTDDLDSDDLGGAVAEDIVAALEDCVTLGVDVINMSLGTSCGFSTTNDGDDEGEMLNAVYESIKAAGITLVCAASNDYSSGYGGTFGTNLASNPDSSTVGSPSTFASALSVASINGQKASYMVANEDDEEDKAFVFYEESRDIDGNPFDFANDLNTLYPHKNGVFEYVVVPGIGQSADYSNTIRRLFQDNNGNSLERIALIKRGDTTFQEKVELAMRMGAIGVIVYNNVAGVIRMNLGEIDDPVPAVSVNMNAGNALVAAATRTKEEIEAGKINRVGTIAIGEQYKAGPFMSEFSSWGPTHDLKLKPEITAHGGEITSTVPGGYGEQSGTSMASPNMAGFMAIVRSYIEKKLGVTDPIEINRLAMQLTMSTAGTVYDQDDLPYSPRKQGAGVAKLENVVGGTGAYLWTDNAENDYRPKLEFGEDEEKTGVYDLTFKVTNFGATALKFSTESLVMTESLATDSDGKGLAVSEQAYMLDDNKAVWTVDGKEATSLEVGAGETKTIGVKITLSEKEKEYIDGTFTNGMYVEGFLKLVSETDGQCDLSIPFLGFYGDWEAAPMLDYSAYEVAESEKNDKEEDQIKASVWATQPYSVYYNEKYILPMGGYVYLLPEDEEPMYADEDKNAVSRYNDYYGEGNTENYLTSTGIKALYAGLLRNARLVKYKLYSVETGELLLEDVCNRVGKAYTAGGAGTPANVELELFPEEFGLAANGQYRMDFEFFMNEPSEGEVAPEENTFSFSFTVDYEAPILEDARIRYYNYKDGNKEKQRIYLDVDVYDNHYAQALMLCYPTQNAAGETVLQMATDYPIPVRDAKKNGTTTVSVEITDIYEHICKEYGNQLYIQIDDYAINSCLYRIQLSNANAGNLPEGDEFDLADGEESLTLDIYQSHKVGLVYGENYDGDGDASNFLWTSKNPKIADVVKGEIVGLSAGKTQITVSNRKGASETIDVTVTDNVTTSLVNVPSISFGVIKNNNEALVKATGTVEVDAGEEFTLEVVTDPWYHPMTDLKLVWETSNAQVASVDENGNVKTLKKGTAIVTATVYKKVGENGWEKTLYSSTVILKVQNEFTVGNYILNDYNGVGYNEIIDGKEYLRIPTDMNVWYIGEEAFKDNKNVKRIIIPASVLQINARAFQNCTALEEVYFVDVKARENADGEIINPDVDWADLTLIFEEAFMGCTNLKKVDFSNAKTITLAQSCFEGCTALSEVVDMPSVGTMHHRAFAGCTSLRNVDLTGLHMSGDYVFTGCTRLASIETGKFTAIGNYMFSGCTGLRNTVTIRTPKLGAGAFSGCINLTGVTFTDPEGENLSFDIGARAFEYCGKNLRVGQSFTVDFGGVTVRSIGDRAFAGSKLTALGEIKGLKTLGANAFANTLIGTIELGDAWDPETLRISGIPFDGITLTVAEGSEKYTEENGVIFNKAKTKLLFVSQSLTGEYKVPDSVEEIAAYAFAKTSLTKVRLGSNVTKLGEGAFENAAIRTVDFVGASITELPARAFYGSALTGVTLPETLVSVGDSAFAYSALNAFEGAGLETLGNRVFEGCEALATIALADGIKEMGDGVFQGCINLTEVALPSLEKLGSYTFYNAKNLQKATFGENASTTGSYTFATTPVTQVVLGEKVTEIGEGAFYNAVALESVTLPAGVTTIGKYAFRETSALKTVEGLENVVYIGDQAFYCSGIQALKLENAKHIGIAAFAYESATGEDVAAKYTAISMPTVETIGAYAFLNGGEAAVELPASVKEIGYGAFASSADLSTIAVEDGNETFFAKNGVLYRYLDKTEGTFELVCYPAAREGEAADGKRHYEVEAGTVIVKAYAFYDLNEGALDSVKLPYSVNSIGDSAFFESGVTEYTFESIQAPVLEAVYREEIATLIEQLATEMTAAYYKGYYYANFGTYLYHFTQFGKLTSELTMYYPENGTGYDTHIYNLYFGEKNTLGVLMTDSTRECIGLIESLYDQETVNGWLTLDKTAENAAMVAQFSETVKEARRLYNNASKDGAQFVYIGEELTEKLLAVEGAMRDVKAYFEIPVTVSELRVDQTSAHKSEYLSGETFDMTGIVVTIVYDDGSTELIGAEDLVLQTTLALTKYSRYVVVKYGETDLRVSVTVTDPPVVDPGPDDPSDSSSVEDSSTETSDPASDTTSDGSDSSTPPTPVKPGDREDNDCGGAPIVVAVILIAAAAVVIVFIIKKKRDEELVSDKKSSKRKETKMKEKALEQKAEEKKYLVNCMNCGAALRVKGKAEDYVYVCPACNNRFRVRIGKEVKDETSASEEK